MMQGKIIARCCNVDLELWVPPTVKCPVCNSVYVWAQNVVCVSGPAFLEHVVVEVKLCKEK